MYISRHEIGNLYNQRLLLEMQEEVVDYVLNNYDPDDLPFEFLFKGRMRMAIPLHTETQVLKLLKEAIRHIKDFDRIDSKTGEVIRKIKLDPKYGGGFKEQRMNLGTAINKMNIPEETKKRFLNWYALYKNNISDALSGKSDQYVIILSRHPIDVVRMSDFGNSIYSCHRRDGEFFHCAVQEAVEGGGIAYLIRISDFNKYKEFLQDDEFFQDDDRGRGHVWPMARLRIRKLKGVDNGEEFAIPDFSIYGDYRIPGFKESLNKFLRAKQPISYEAFLRKNYTDPLRHVGGSYLDDSMGSLVSRFFGKAPDQFLKDTINTGYNTRLNHKNFRHPEYDAQQFLDDIDSSRRDLDNAIQILDNYNGDYGEINYIEEEYLEVSYDFSIPMDINGVNVSNLKNLQCKSTRIRDLDDFWKTFVDELDLKFNNRIRLGYSENHFSFSETTVSFSYSLGAAYDEEDANEMVRTCEQIDEDISDLTASDITEIFLDSDMYEESFVELYKTFENELTNLHETLGWGYDISGFSVNVESPHIIITPNLYDEWGIHPYSDMNKYFFKLLMNFTKIHFEPISPHKAPEQLQLSLTETYTSIYDNPVSSISYKYFEEFLDISEMNLQVDANPIWGARGIQINLSIDFKIMSRVSLDWLNFLAQNYQSIEHLMEFAILISTQDYIDHDLYGGHNIYNLQNQKAYSYILDRYHRFYKTYSKYL